MIFRVGGIVYIACSRLVGWLIETDLNPGLNDGHYFYYPVPSSRLYTVVWWLLSSLLLLYLRGLGVGVHSFIEVVRATESSKQYSVSTSHNEGVCFMALSGGSRSIM